MSANDAAQNPQDSTQEIAVTTQAPAPVFTGKFQKGVWDERRRHGGRPKRLREIEQMLNKEHRNLEKMRELFARLRSLAMGEPILIPVMTASGEMTVAAKLEADPAFMKLYLERTLGKAKVFEDDIDFSDAPAEFLEYIKSKLVNSL